MGKFRQYITGLGTLVAISLVPIYPYHDIKENQDAGNTSHLYRDQIDLDCENVPLKKAAIKSLKSHCREFLPPADGSYKEGKNIIIDIKEFRTADKGKTQFEIVQGGNFPFVAVQTGAGIYFNVPDEPIRTGVTLEELVRLLRGEKVSGTVMGIDGKVEQSYKVLFRYTGGPK